MPEIDFEYLGRRITLSLQRQCGGWIGVFSIDGDGTIQLPGAPAYSERQAYEAAGDAARALVRSGLI